MSTEEVFVQQFARLFVHYCDALGLDPVSAANRHFHQLNELPGADRFVYALQEVGKLPQNALEFPPMQKGASFNLEVIKEQLAKKMAAQNQ